MTKTCHSTKPEVYCRPTNFILLRPYQTRTVTTKHWRDICQRFQTVDYIASEILNTLKAHHGISKKGHTSGTKETVHMEKGYKYKKI